MQIHKEGRNSILLSVLFALVLIYLGTRVDNVLTQRFIYLLSVIPFIFILYFFRKPKRPFAVQPDFVFAPADGTVVAIEKVFVDEYLEEERIQVSIFMSPFNVHINWVPLTGKVVYSKHHHGKYLVAWHPKSSTENERTSIVIENKDGRSLLIRQIAGAMARRIVNYLTEGKEVNQGEELGFIKFGSRVDVFLPLDVTIKVSLEEKVEGNRSVIAEWPRS